MKKRLMSIFIAVVIIITMLPAISASAWGNIWGNWRYDVARVVATGQSFASILSYNGTETVVTIPSSIPTTFAGLPVTAPVVDIRSNAFSSNANINTIIIPESITHIEANAVIDCINLNTVIFKRSIPPIFGSGGNHPVFVNSPVTTVYVPAGSMAAYQAIPQLSGFNIVEINDGDKPCEDCEKEPCECEPDGDKPCEDCEKEPCECVSKPEPCENNAHTWSTWTRIGTTNREERTCSSCGFREERDRRPGNSSGGSAGGGGGPGGSTVPPSTTTTPPVINIVQIGTGTMLPNFQITRAAINIAAGALSVAQLRITSAGEQDVNLGTDNAGQNALLIRLNAESGELEVVSATTIGAGGNAVINVAAAGDFIVMARKTGDVTGTGEVETSDALALLRHVAGVAELNPIQQFAANGKAGDVGTNDALNILRYVAGITGRI